MAITPTAPLRVRALFSARQQRRLFLQSLSALALGISSRAWALGKPRPSHWQPAQFGFKSLDLRLAGRRDLARRALLLVPDDVKAGERLPLLVLLHGYAQGKRTGDPSGELRAIRAWQAEYGVTQADQRLRSPPIERLYQGVRYLSDARIADLGARLSARPYQRMVFACPMTPIPYYEQRTAPLFEEYSAWITEELLPAVRRRCPATTAPGRTGIAGHSMGGEVALEVLLRRPQHFGACMLLQAALEKRRAARYAERLAESGTNPSSTLHILTSTRDLYREANRSLRDQLKRRGVTPQFTEPFGHHATSFVRDVGSLELLLWMDQQLRKDTSPERRFGGYPAGYPMRLTPG